MKHRSDIDSIFPRNTAFFHIPRYCYRNFNKVYRGRACVHWLTFWSRNAAEKQYNIIHNELLRFNNLMRSIQRKPAWTYFFLTFLWFFYDVQLRTWLKDFLTAGLFFYLIPTEFLKMFGECLRAEDPLYLKTENDRSFLWRGL